MSFQSELEVDKPTWLIAGAAGFLGANFPLILSDSVRLVGLARRSISLPGYDDCIHIDLQDSRAVCAEIERVNPDIVVNAAALASHSMCERESDLALALNRDVASNLATAARACGAYLIHISTDAVFDGRRGHYSEEDPVSPFSVYGRTKLAGEEAVCRALPGALIARTNFFGWSPAGDRSILEFFDSALRSQTVVRGYTDFVVSSIYVLHLIEFLVELAARRTSGIVHVAAQDGLSKFEFGQLIARELERPSTLIIPTSSTTEGLDVARNRDLSLDTSLLKTLTGRSTPTQQQGVHQAFLDRHRINAHSHGKGP